MNEIAADLEVGAGIIPASVSLAERRTRTLKHDDTFAVFDHNGDALSAPGRPEGIFSHDTRHLSQLYLTISGQRPLLLSSSLHADNAMLTCDLTNPDFVPVPGEAMLPHDLIHIRRSRFLWKGVCYERLAVRNFDQVTHRFSLTIWFASDFADLFEVRGAHRPRRGTLNPPLVDASEVQLTYVGLDGVSRQTVLRFDPKPSHLAPHEATFELELPPDEQVSIFVEVHCGPADNEPAGRTKFFRALKESRRATRFSMSRAAVVSSSSEVFDAVIDRARSDLYMLVTMTQDGPYPYAGIPWFSTMFGRDALITAMETLWVDPTIALGRAAQPRGPCRPPRSIPRARRSRARSCTRRAAARWPHLGEVPFAPLLRQRRLHPALRHARRRATSTAPATSSRSASSGRNIEAALGWIENYGDRDGDGFVEYGAGPRRRARQPGLEGQPRFRLPRRRHAGAERRSRWSRCRAMSMPPTRRPATWRAALGHEEMAGDLARPRQHLARQFRPELLRCGTRHLCAGARRREAALPGADLQCRPRALLRHRLSGAGRAGGRGADGAELLSRLGHPDARLDRDRYNPMSYHNGSVWPHDNALIAAGFARYGFRRQSARVLEGLFAAAAYTDLRRLPELFCGFPRQSGQGPTSYPVACSPQAWAAATPFSLLQSCLGMVFDPQPHEITFHHPVLPNFLNELVLRKLAVGDGRLDIGVRRAGAEIAINIVERFGPARMIVRG